MTSKSIANAAETLLMDVSQKDRGMPKSIIV